MGILLGHPISLATGPTGETFQGRESFICVRMLASGDLLGAKEDLNESVSF